MSDMTMGGGGREARAMRGAARAAAEDATASAMRVGSSVEPAMNAGLAWLDLMVQMQRASLAAFSVYSPGSDTRISGRVPQRGQAGTQVIPMGEERLNIATRTELGQTTRLRRRVVAQPVEQEVTLREERVVVERRPAAAHARQGDAAAPPPPRGEVLTETVVEMTDSRQVPQVWKSVHVAEEVVLRREVTERTERVRETLRRDVLEVERDRDARGAFEVGPAPHAVAEREAAKERTEALAEAAREALSPAAEARPADARPAEARPAEDAGTPPDRKPAAPPAATPPRKG